MLPFYLMFFSGHFWMAFRTVHCVGVIYWSINLMILIKILYVTSHRWTCIILFILGFSFIIIFLSKSIIYIDSVLVAISPNRRGLFIKQRIQFCHFLFTFCQSITFNSFLFDISLMPSLFYVHVQEIPSNFIISGILFVLQMEVRLSLQQRNTH